MSHPPTPFTADPIDEIRLKQAPLALALAQVRYPLVPAMNSMDGIAPVYGALRDGFPTLHQDRTVGLVLSPQGVTTEQSSETVWRLVDEAGNTRVSVSPSFAALDTRAYHDRASFMAQFGVVLEVVEREIAPTACERVGVRFVNRLVGDDALRLRSFVRAEVRGEFPVPNDDEATLAHSLSAMVYMVPEGLMQIRFGQLPAGAVIDPAIDVADSPSWVLDLDVFKEVSTPFSAGEICAQATAAALRAYKFFRWSMTDDFMAHVGVEG